MCERVKNAKRLPGNDNEPLYLPGERGDQVAEENKRRGCIDLPEKIYNQLLDIVSG